MKKIKKSFFCMLAMASASALLFTSSTLRLSPTSNSSRDFSAIWLVKSQIFPLYSNLGDTYLNPLDDSDDNC